ncbi:MAG TPA: response regulator transcription factor [Rugosimonospora sp.]|nr:response regulator transcription factor [Rugosimonospora sp.]
MPGGLLRGALRFVLSTQDDIEVVAEHDSLDGLLADGWAGRPDVTVLDLDLLGSHRVPLAEHPALTVPDSRTLVLVDPRRSGALGARLAGSSPQVGFLAHTVAPERVVDGIRRLHRGEPVLDGDLVAAALRAKSPLTGQEIRVLQAAALGAPVKEIATKLGLSPGTVRNYLSRIIAKTGARTRIEAVHIAQEAGWF